MGTMTVRDSERVDSDSTVIVRVTPRRDLSVWRDIELRLDQSLHALHLAIQNAFELDDEHLYAFYMNGHAFDRAFGFEGCQEDDRPSAGDVTLGQFALPKNKRFLYLFDFGDELRHHVKVISRGGADATVTYPRVVASEGKAPPQYVDWPVEDSEAQDEDADDDVHGSAQDPLARLGEPMRQQLEQLVPRVEQVIERQQDRLMDDCVAEAETSAELAQEYAVACSLFDAASGDPQTMSAVIEPRTSWSIWTWLCGLADELSLAALHEQALDLASRVYAAIGDDAIRIRLPGFLQRAGRESEARAMLGENLEEFPEDAYALAEAAEFELAAGDVFRAERHYREALKWAGTRLKLRERILVGLTELLRTTQRPGALQTLQQEEEDFMFTAFPEYRAQKPVRRQSPKVGRNDPCPCGSGKKSKKCCGAAK